MYRPILSDYKKAYFLIFILLLFVIGCTKSPSVADVRPNKINYESFEVNVSETSPNMPYHGYQGKLDINISDEDLKNFRSEGKNVSVIGIPAYPKTSFGFGQNKLRGASAIFQWFIGPTYTLYPKNTVLKNQAFITLCYAPDMIDYSSSLPINESKVKIWMGNGDYLRGTPDGLIDGVIDTKTHCVSGSIKEFPENGIGVYVPPPITLNNSNIQKVFNILKDIPIKFNENIIPLKDGKYIDEKTGNEIVIAPMYMAVGDLNNDGIMDDAAILGEEENGTTKTKYYVIAYLKNGANGLIESTNTVYIGYASDFKTGIVPNLFFIDNNAIIFNYQLYEDYSWISKYYVIQDGILMEK